MRYQSATEREKLVIRQQYDANASFKNLFSFTGTCFQSVFGNALFWILVSIHTALYAAKEIDQCPINVEACPASGPKTDGCCTSFSAHLANVSLKLGDVAMLSEFSTFLIVLYSGNCYARYSAMYASVIAIQGKLHNISLYLRAYYTRPTSRWNVLRYLLASHYIFYWSIRDRYHRWGNSQYKEDPGSFRVLCDKVLLPKGLMIGMEVDMINDYRGNKHKLLFSWSIVALKRIMAAPPPQGEKGNPMLSSEFEQTSLISNLKEEIVSLRSAMGSIENYMLFPIPFQYYHIVNVTLFINLLLLSYAFLSINSIFSIPAYFVVCLCMLGLRETANAMADPFGKTDWDFNQHAIEEGIYNDCKSLCEEPEEEFLCMLGTPDFNPQRKEDGMLMEGASISKLSQGGLPVKQVLWTQSDVQAIIDERDDLKAKLMNGGAEGLAQQLEELVKIHTTTTERLQQISNIPRELQVANDAALSRVDRLEELLTNQLIRLAADVRSDTPDLSEKKFVSQLLPRSSAAPTSIFRGPATGGIPSTATRRYP
jgi:hypothetical protein